jgi:cytochrome c oxidase subunit 3
MDPKMPVPPETHETKQVLHLHAAREQAFTDYLGMMLGLAALSMMFGGLFYGYATLRVRSQSWPPDGLPDLPVLLPAISTALLLASSACLQWTMGLLKKDDARKSFHALLGANLLGACFLVSQSVLWTTLYRQGLHWSSKAYGSVFYSFTALHAFHVLVGMFFLLRLVPRHHKGEFTGRRHMPIRITSMYWHFVDVVWVAMFLSIFVI